VLTAERNRLTSKMTALPLVTLAKDGKFELQASTLKKLSQLQGPVAVIAIAGLYRTGKSYLLNRLLGKQKGFAVGPTVNPCTKGIYVWGDPPKRNGVNIILLDTEGLGSTQQDQSYDTKIFSLALLLSSYFIYNSMGTIDERALEGLHLVTNLTKHISAKSNTAMSSFMPNFIWCLRDFSLKLEDENGVPMTEAQYLENSLNFTSSKSAGKDDKKSSEKNAIRECIKTFFPRRDCACLVRPTNEESELQNSDAISENKLRPQFLKQMSALTEKILSGVQPKRIMNQSVTGERFVLLLENYVNAFNNGMAPEILGTWESIAILENQKIVKNELATYENGLTVAMKHKPLDDATLTKTNNALKLAAMNSIQKNGFGEDVSKLSDEFETASAEIFRKVEKENLKASNEVNSKLLEDLYRSRIFQKLNQNEFANVSKLSQAWNELETHYINIAKGSQSSRLHSLNQFLGAKKNESFSLFSEHVAQINQAEIENLKKISSEFKKNAKEAEKKLNDNLQKVSAEKHNLELNHVKASEELKMLKERHQDSLNKIKEFEKKCEDLNEKIKESGLRERKVESSNTEVREKFRKSEIEIDTLKKEVKQLRENEKRNESSDLGLKNMLKKKDSDIESLEREIRILKESDKKSEASGNKIKDSLREREAEIEVLKRDIQQFKEFEKRNESSNQELKSSMKKKDSEIEKLEKENRLLRAKEKNSESDTSEIKATLEKYESENNALKTEKSTLTKKLATNESDMKNLLETRERKITSLEKELNEKEKQQKENSNEILELRMTNDRLTSQIHESENSSQSKRIQTPTQNRTNKHNNNNNNNNRGNFEPHAFHDINNEMDEEIPQASNNRFEKLNQAVVPSPSKKRKQPVNIVAQDEEEEPVTKKRKSEQEDFNKLSVAQLRGRIKDIDHTAIPMSAISKAKLVEILESLTKK